MLISPAFAQEAAASQSMGGDALMQFLPLIFIFVVFYFLLIRPQQKRAKLHREMLSALKRGDRVMTSGGIIGVITKVDEKEVTLEIAENVKVRVVRATVQDLAPVSGNVTEAKANDN